MKTAEYSKYSDINKDAQQQREILCGLISTHNTREE